MSVSLTSARSKPDRRITAVRITRAGDDHVAAPGRHDGERRPLRVGHPHEAARTASAVSSESHVRWIASGS